MLPGLSYGGMTLMLSRGKVAVADSGCIGVWGPLILLDTIQGLVWWRQPVGAWAYLFGIPKEVASKVSREEPWTFRWSKKDCGLVEANRSYKD